jgi:hypothetical protein
MRITRRKVLFTVGLIMAGFGLFLVVGSTYEFLHPSARHGYGSSIPVGLLGLVLLATGVSLCCERNAA